MNIFKIPAGIYAANCYIVYCEDTKEGIVIDPGGSVDEIMDIIKENNLTIRYILLTHGHGDHIGGVKELKELLDVAVLAHEDEVDLLANSDLNLSNMMAMGPIELNIDKELKDDETIYFGNHKGQIIHTPGHSKGGICFKVNDYLFTGDTLFKQSVGRSDLHGGDHELLINSIRNKLLAFSNDTKVFPGHGDSSTLGHEKLFNKFLQ